MSDTRPEGTASARPHRPQCHFSEQASALDVRPSRAPAGEAARPASCRRGPRACAPSLETRGEMLSTDGDHENRHVRKRAPETCSRCDGAGPRALCPHPRRRWAHRGWTRRSRGAAAALPGGLDSGEGRRAPETLLADAGAHSRPDVSCVLPPLTRRPHRWCG